MKLSKTADQPTNGHEGLQGSYNSNNSRWDVIGNMIQFTNAVAGQPVKNWNAGPDYLAFAR